MARIFPKPRSLHIGINGKSFERFNDEDAE
jgi:hypothetical protein